MEITVTLVGADEVIEKLEAIKKLMKGIEETNSQLKISGETIGKVMFNQYKGEMI